MPCSYPSPFRSTTTARFGVTGDKLAAGRWKLRRWASANRARIVFCRTLVTQITCRGMSSMKRFSLLIFVALLLSVTAAAQPLPPPLPPLDPALLAQADAQGTVRVVIQFAAQTAGRSPQEAADIIK